MALTIKEVLNNIFIKKSTEIETIIDNKLNNGDFGLYSTYVEVNIKEILHEDIHALITEAYIKVGWKDVLHDEDGDEDGDITYIKLLFK